MPWTPEPGAGFTTPEATPWLPIGLEAGRTVAEQRADRGSVLHLVRDLIGLRRDESDLHRGTYASLPSPDGAWAYARGDGHAVALNLSGEPVTVEGVAGRVLICTHRRRDGERVAGSLELGPWTGAVVAAR
jgi:glycosidase